jgi:hypothetical protein
VGAQPQKNLALIVVISLSAFTAVVHFMNQRYSLCWSKKFRTKRIFFLFSTSHVFTTCFSTTEVFFLSDMLVVTVCWLNYVKCSHGLVSFCVAYHLLVAVCISFDTYTMYKCYRKCR